ncbi:unnamed protein product [Closterium sp. Naga37s-1]|nr:unnamed protein product [Closterium sp. Naga37s-1]
MLRHDVTHLKAQLAARDKSGSLHLKKHLRKHLKQHSGVLVNNSEALDRRVVMGSSEEEEGGSRSTGWGARRDERRDEIGSAGYRGGVDGRQSKGLEGERKDGVSEDAEDYVYGGRRGGEDEGWGGGEGEEGSGGEDDEGRRSGGMGESARALMALWEAAPSLGLRDVRSAAVQRALTLLRRAVGEQGGEQVGGVGTAEGEGKETNEGVQQARRQADDLSGAGGSVGGAGEEAWLSEEEEQQLVPAAPHVDDCASLATDISILDSRSADGALPDWSLWGGRLGLVARRLEEREREKLEQEEQARALQHEAMRLQAQERMQERQGASEEQAEVAAWMAAARDEQLMGDHTGAVLGPYPPWVSAVARAMCRYQVSGADEDNLPMTRRAQRDVWVHQHPRNCSHPSVKFLVVDVLRKVRGSFLGVGAQVNWLAGVLGTAVMEGRVLVVRHYHRAAHDGCHGGHDHRAAHDGCHGGLVTGLKGQGQWVVEGRVLVVRHYHRAAHNGCHGCSGGREGESGDVRGVHRGRWSCYFVPETSPECRQQALHLLHFSRQQALHLLHSSRPTHATPSNRSDGGTAGDAGALAARAARFLPSNWPKTLEQLPDLTSRNALGSEGKIEEIWQAASGGAIGGTGALSGNGAYRAAGGYLPEGLVAVHVRQGDKAGEMAMAGLEVYVALLGRVRRRFPYADAVWLSTEMQGDKTGEMAMAGVDVYLALLGRVRRQFPHADFVWLSTEMQAVVDAARHYTRWRFHATDFPRQAAGESMDAYDARVGEQRATDNIFVNLLVSADAPFFVGTMGSTWSVLIDNSQQPTRLNPCLYLPFRLPCLLRPTQAVVDAAKHYTRWRFHVTDFPRQAVGESMDAYDARVGEQRATDNAFVNLLVSADAPFFVGTMGSTWSVLIDNLRVAGRGKARVGMLSVNRDRYWFGETWEVWRDLYRNITM